MAQRKYGLLLAEFDFGACCVITPRTALQLQTRKRIQNNLRSHAATEREYGEDGGD